MDSKRLLLLCLIQGLIFSTSYCASLDYYTAGVVEFRQSILGLDAWSENLEAYVEIINSENASATDIIVFPESTLNALGSTTFVPNPEDNINPCLNGSHYEEFLVTLSCAARNVSKYIVINLTEKQKCEDTPDDPRPCASNGLNIFNTNVVFDRQGVVVSRYRKVHLYAESKNLTYLPELVTFETDFGVTFGQFICFDILFYTPAHQLIVEQGITDFVYPTMWFSQLPFLTAVQIQQGWAYAQNVNLLAAGASRPSVGSTGSGIFHGRQGTLTSVMKHDIGERAIYVAQVPKITRRSRRALQDTRQLPASTDFYMMRDALEIYETQLLQLDVGSNGSSTGHICQDSFCCNYDLVWRPQEGPVAQNAKYYSYRVGVYDGVRKDQNVDSNYIRNCGLFACLGERIEECGLLPEEGVSPQSPVIFTRLAIKVTYPESRHFLLIPDTLLDNLMPLEPNQFEWSQTTKESYQHEVHFALAESHELGNLLTFAVYGNYYDNDCTFGMGTEAEQLACGYKGNSSPLRSLGPWLIAMPLILLGLTLSR
ncbi:vanin-like protein 1 [Drosophila serrata]|uniref:vanin-like protein 1 n=1 Tax=Drosophila serrata TaxID=7274 RepID=UPI000A1D3852|nr:vanin-like protein 1 [Drosophila serrata]